MTNSISEAMIEAGYEALCERKPLLSTDWEKEAVEAIYLAMSRAVDTGGMPAAYDYRDPAILGITPPVDSEAVERVAFAARAFCAELQEDGEGVPQPQLKRLHDALDAWEMIAPEAAYDDSTEMTALLASLKWIVEDGNEPDRVRQTARAAMSAILSLAKGWQPLDTFAEPTSPGSGDGVLIAERDGTVGEACFRNFGDDDDGWWWINTTWGDYPEPVRPAPVLWMPLPGADAALTARKEDDRG